MHIGILADMLPIMILKYQNSPILGANDGGSGVGVLLEMARQFSKKNPKIGVDIILFDAEDYGQPENSGLPYHARFLVFGFSILE